jgi:hypothetical protein
VTADDPTSAAADLAEQILDEVSSRDQNWSCIAALARELVVLADAVVMRDPTTPRSEES